MKEQRQQEPFQFLTAKRLLRQIRESALLDPFNNQWEVP